MSKKAVVLLSGGIDSTTCLALAVDSFGPKEVLALCMYYGQRHDKERESARNVAEFYGVDLMERDLSGAFTESTCSLLAHSSKEVAHASYADQLKEVDVVETYVPFRNGLFLAYAASVAIGVGARVVYYGAHADDAVGGACYPDCTPEFAEAMHEAIFEGSGRSLIMHAPLLHKTKAEVVALGLALGAPYHLTWSCYEGKDKPCGCCGTCIDRAKAFEENGVADPAM